MAVPQRFVTVGLCFLCTFICYLERVGFSVAYTAAAKGLGTDQATKGWVLSAFYYGYATSQVPGGWAASRFGGRSILFLSFLLWSTASLLTPAKPKPLALLILARLVIGVCQGITFPAIHTVLAQWIPPHERSRAVSLTTSGMYLGASAAMLCLPELVAYRGPAVVFQLVGSLGLLWALLWLLVSSDPPGSTAEQMSLLASPSPRKRRHSLDRAEEGAGQRAADVDFELEVVASESGEGKSRRAPGAVIPWKALLLSMPVWAIIANNFTFHYALYVLMNWLPTYFDQGLHAALANMGFSKMLPYLLMFIFSNVGGVVADYVVTRRIMPVGAARKWLNTVGFTVSVGSLLLMPQFHTVKGALACSSTALGALAFGRAGFAVNHMDIAPRYAGVVMGLSNTAGTLAGVVGVAATGFTLQTASSGSEHLTGWGAVFATPALLCLSSAAMFVCYAKGDRLFD